MKIYNSLTRKKEEFIPINPPNVNIYTCGVTVYDECHIGHARSLYIFDVIRRYLEHKRFNVRFVRNITDIDDKIINRANELKTDWKDLVEKYIASYSEDLKSLGISKGILDSDKEEPRATKNITDMVKYIKGLIDKGYAYESEGDVYFSVRKFSDYGKLSGQSVDQMLEGVRIDPGDKKKDPLDFALWKKSKENEPSWQSPWGEGRPGWHIECSVMSQKFLNSDTLDIHAGGRDLIFPHHENEIAQAEAFTGKPFARYWIHHGLLTINSQKMSKSLGNFITIKDFINRYSDVDFLKLFFLSAHYSHPIDYSDERVKEAGKQKKTFNQFMNRLNNWFITKKGKQETATTKKDIDSIDNICKRFYEAMDDDFNMPQALACLFELSDLASALISTDKREGFEYIGSRLKTFFEIFGLKPEVTRPLRQEGRKKAMDREETKRNRDYNKADTIRQELQKEYDGVLMDTGSGVTFIED